MRSFTGLNAAQAKALQAIIDEPGRHKRELNRHTITWLARHGYVRVDAYLDSEGKHWTRLYPVPLEA